MASAEQKRIARHTASGRTLDSAEGVTTAIAAPDAVTALAPPAGGSGATAGAYDGATNRDLMIASLTAVRVDVIALRAKQVEILALLTAAGLAD